MCMSSLDVSEDVLWLIIKTINYFSIVKNLKAICDLKSGEKLRVIDDEYLVVDRRYLQNIQRHFNSDSRKIILNFVTHVMNVTRNFCLNNNYDSDDMILSLSLLLTASDSLYVLSQTYGNDEYAYLTILNLRAILTHLTQKYLTS